MVNPELEILFLIHNAVKVKHPSWLKGVSFDNDNDSGEIIFDLFDGSSFTLSTKDIKETDTE